jgi:hypothetical protein
MLMMDYEDDDKKQARFFRICLIDGSVAAQWYETIGDNVKSDWTLLMGALKLRFGDTAEDKHIAFREMVSSKLGDEEVGRASSSEGLSKHVIWARKVTVLSTRAGADPSNNNAYLVYNNVGQHLQGLLTSSGATNSVQAITSKVETLTPVEVESVVRAVNKERENAEINKRMIALERQLNKGTPAFSQSGASQPLSWRKQGQENVTINPGPFPTTAAGVEAYKRSVAAFYDKYGQGASSAISRPYPLSPGTVAAGSNECFNCGLADHLRPNCRAKAPIPVNEQRYRGLVMQQQRATKTYPATGSNTQQLIRSMSTVHLDESHFTHLQFLPMTPEPDNNQALYDDEYEFQGNGGDLSL